MSSAASGTWWQVFPLGFLGAEREALPAGSAVQHRLPLLEAWLDYAVELGVEGLVLGPVFDSQTHGYDTSDYYRVDPRLGDEDDLVHLVRRAHDVGLRVVLDGVFNHVGRGFGAFADLLQHGPASQYASWFRVSWPEPDGEPQVEVFEGHEHLVALNHDEPAVAGYVASVMDYWCSRGVDGWRLDAAYAVPATFWRQVLTGLRERHPQVWVFGELIHGDYAGFVADSGVDTVTQYELWKAIGSCLNDANFWELSHALGRHADFLAEFSPITFLGNHDTTRIASLLDDPRHLPHAIAVLLGVGGTPVIYYGDEQAYHGVKYERVGGDDEVRPQFPAAPLELSTLGASTHALHRRLIGLRKARPWLARAVTSVGALTNTTIVLISAEPVAGDRGRRSGRSQGGQRVAVALSLDDDPVSLELPDPGWELVEGDGRLDGGRVHLPPHGWSVLIGG